MFVSLYLENILLDIFKIASLHQFENNLQFSNKQEPETPVIPQVPVKPIVQESQPQLSTSSHELLDETTDNSDIAVEIKENTYANGKTKCCKNTIHPK